MFLVLLQVCNLVKRVHLGYLNVGVTEGILPFPSSQLQFHRYKGTGYPVQLALTVSIIFLIAPEFMMLASSAEEPSRLNRQMRKLNSHLML